MANRGGGSGIQPDAPGSRYLLLRHELAIAVAGLRFLSHKPIDLLTVLICLPVFIFILQAWTAGQPDQLLQVQAAAIGFFAAFYSARGLLARDAYHRTDGIVARQAQRAGERLGWALPLFGAAVVPGFAYLAIVNAARPMLWLVATLLGAGAAAALSAIARVLRERRPALSPWLRPGHLRSPRAWLALLATGAALGLTCTALPFEAAGLAIAAADVALVAVVALGRVDAMEVQYRTMVGNSSLVIIGTHGLPLLAFFTAFTATLSSAPPWEPSAVAAVLGAAVLVFMAVRVLAYQAFDRRIADWFVTGLFAIAGMAGLMIPPAALVAMLFGVVWLARRAASQRWSIA